MGIDEKYLDRQITAADPEDSKSSVRFITTVALAAYTRIGNVITADANGAMVDQDGVTPVTGDDFILNSAGSQADADNGIWTATFQGNGGNPYTLERRGDADADDLVTSGLNCKIEEGLDNAAEEYILVTANPITLNTTALIFAKVGSTVPTNVFRHFWKNSDSNGLLDGAAVLDTGTFNGVYATTHRWSNAVGGTCNLPQIAGFGHNAPIAFVEIVDDNTPVALTVNAFAGDSIEWEGETNSSFDIMGGGTTVILVAEAGPDQWRVIEGSDHLVLGNGISAATVPQLQYFDNATRKNMIIGGGTTGTPPVQNEAWGWVNGVATPQALAGSPVANSADFVFQVAETTSGTKNDYAPSSAASWQSSYLTNLTASGADIIVTGFLADTTGSTRGFFRPFRWVRCADGSSNDVVLKHQDAGSANANKIITPDGADLTLLPGDVALLVYNRSTSRWWAVNIVAGLGGGGGSLADTTDDQTLQTTTATPATIATYATVGTAHATSVKAVVWGRQSATSGGGTVGDSAKYIVEALFERTGGTLTSLDENVLSIFESNAAWDVNVVVDGTSVDVNVTGIASADIEWRCQLEVSEHG